MNLRDRKMRITLTSNNLADQLVRYGFFAEVIPSCFSSSSFADALPRLMPLINCSHSQAKKGKDHSTEPLEISTYKNEIARRVLSIPNPESFLRVVKLLSENWPSIQEFASSTNSLSSITYMRSYSSGMELEEINSENMREAVSARSDYVDGIKACIRAATGKQCRLKVDIANFYNTIYTHSVAWAVCEKEHAKSYMKSKQPSSLKDNYELCDSLDAFMRFQKRNETNGIIVGPYTSRVFSEIILSAIDRRLREKGFIFMRYVDDFKFYFRNESEARQSLPIIERILNEYNLNLNPSKTEVQNFPYEMITDMRGEYDSAMSEDGIFGVINSASILHAAGEKGAFKYAIKYIRKKNMDLGSVYTRNMI